MMVLAGPPPLLARLFSSPPRLSSLIISARRRLNASIRVTSGEQGESLSVFGGTVGTSNFSGESEVKRGDWVCATCSFINFSRNMKCLQCQEARPMRKLTGAEWECPQCDFFNYGKNISCLRCDCERPCEVPIGSSGSKSSNGRGEKSQIGSKLAENGSENMSYGNSATGSSISESLDRILRRSPGTFSRNNVPQGSPKSDKEPFSAEPEGLPGSSVEASSFGSRSNEEPHLDLGVASEKDFPDLMPLRRGENRFVVSKKKDRSLTSPQYKRRLALEEANNSNFVPFVPFPPDYFAKKDKHPGASAASEGPANSETQLNSATSNQKEKASERSRIDSAASGTPNLGSGARVSVEEKTQAGEVSQKGNSRNGDSGKSLEGSGVKEPDPLDMSEEAKTKRWFRRAAQMRKGVNKFVVSKRKTTIEKMQTYQYHYHFRA